MTAPALPDVQLPERRDARPAHQRRRTGLRLATASLVGIASIGALAASGLGSSLVYYKTPSELVRDPALHGQRLRVGGLVQPGSVTRTDAGVSFTLSDGVTDVPVVNTGTPTSVFRAGQGAVVEGRWDDDGTFRSDTLIVKHSNEYRSGDGRPYAPPTGPR